MAEIVLQFSTQSDPASLAVRAFQHGFWCSHVDTVMPDASLLGARYVGGVLIRPPGYAKFERTQTVRLPTTQDVVDDYLLFLRAQLGKPYDTTAILGMTLDRDWRSPDEWFCDELVFAGLERRFLPLPLPTGINRLTPADLMLVCSIFANVQASQAQ